MLNEAVKKVLQENMWDPAAGGIYLDGKRCVRGADFADDLPLGGIVL